MITENLQQLYEMTYDELCYLCELVLISRKYEEADRADYERQQKNQSNQVGAGM